MLDEPTAPDGASEPPESDGSRKPRVGGLVWLLLVLAVIAVAVAFWSWRDADNDPDRARAALRDTAVVEGTAAVETMTTMDGRDVEAGIKAWQSVSTGVLHDQLLSVGDSEQQMLADQGKIASGRVVQAALTELTDRSATLLAAVEVTVKPTDGSEAPAVKRNRFSADLVLVNGQWKIENLQQVAVNI
jgi:Mce-associated membrane protein